MRNKTSDRYLVISADCHAGLPTEQYRPYVDPAFREAFDGMIAERSEQARVRSISDPDFAQKWLEENKEGISGAWNGERRDKGICECSGAHSDSNPRSSTATASSVALIA